MINETKIDTQIAELGRLADKVVNLYEMSLKMQKAGSNNDLYAGVNVMLLQATSKYQEHWKKLNVFSMSENDREKIKHITQRTDNKIRDMKRIG